MTRTNSHQSPPGARPADLAGCSPANTTTRTAILGAHEYGDHTVIRALRPHATEVVALVGDERYPLHARRLRPVRGRAAVRRPDRLPPRGQLPDRRRIAHTIADAYRFLPTLGEVDLHLFAEGRHERLWEVLGAHPRSFTTADGVVDGVVVRGVGAERQGRQPDRRVQPLGRQRGADARARLVRGVGAVLARLPHRRPVQVPGARRRRLASPTAPTRWRSPPRCRRRPRRGCTPATTRWGDDDWMTRARQAQRRCSSR